MPVKCYLSLGSNIGDRKKNLEDAKKNILEKIGDIITQSSIYETEPWGFHAEQNFFNQVIAITTHLQPMDLLKKSLAIESKLGRERTSENYESRPIDIDILFYGHKIINESKLIVPHPELHKRNFVLIPLNELDPDFRHPIKQKKIY